MNECFYAKCKTSLRFAAAWKTSRNSLLIYFQSHSVPFRLKASRLEAKTHEAEAKTHEAEAKTQLTPRGRGQVFRPRGRGQASRPNIPGRISKMGPQFSISPYMAWKWAPLDKDTKYVESLPLDPFCLPPPAAADA